MPCFIFIFVCAYFCNEIDRYQFQRLLKYFSILWPMYHDVRFEYVSWKNVWFSIMSIVWISLSHKNEKFWFRKSMKYFCFLIKKYMMSDLNLPHSKMSDFVSFQLFGFTLVIKLKNSDLLKYFNFFYQKKKKRKKMSDLNMSCQTVWFGLSFVV